MGGVCYRGSGPGGVSAPEGMSAMGGVCYRGVWSRGVSALGVVCSGGCLLPGGVVSQHALRQNPPVNRMTDRCKNITWATTSLPPVMTTPPPKRFTAQET